MFSRYIPAKLFFAAATLLFATGMAVNFHHLPFDLLTPSLALAWLMLPRLVPFSAAIIAAGFGLIYFDVERRLGTSPDVGLAAAHFVAFLVAVTAHVAGVKELSRFVGIDNPPPSSTFSLLPFECLVLSAILTVVLFIGSIARRHKLRSA